MNISKALAVQSYCFRNFKDNKRVAELVKECGLSRIEVCAVHADFSDEGCFDSVIDAYASADVQIVGIGVQQFKNKPEDEEKFFKFAQRAGVKTISANFGFAFSKDAFKTAEELAEKYDINVAIHNHGGKHWLGSSGVLKVVFQETGPRIGLMLDTAWALDSREDPVAMIRTFGERLYGVHIKDFVFDRARKPEDVVIGTGNLDLPGMVTALKEVSFSGAPILEYEGDIENPVPALTECVEVIRKEAGHE